MDTCILALEKPSRFWRLYSLASIYLAYEYICAWILVNAYVLYRELWYVNKYWNGMSIQIAKL